MKLKRKWVIAILIAALELNVLARNAVIVVPILAPKINAPACLSLITFLATKGTTKEVVTVLDLIAAVVNKPHPKDLKGFLKKNFLNLDCEPNPKTLEITFRKNRMEPKSIMSESPASK